MKNRPDPIQMNPVSSLFRILIYLVLSGAVAIADPPALAKMKAGVDDPRFWPSLTLLYDCPDSPNGSVQDAILVHATYSHKPANVIVGFEESFTDEQIIAGVRAFYSSWKSKNEPGKIPPPLILASQNWGSALGLATPFEKIGQEFKIDVYQLHPVIFELEVGPNHPTPNDKKLVELMGNAPPK